MSLFLKVSGNVQTEAGWFQWFPSKFSDFINWVDIPYLGSFWLSCEASGLKLEINIFPMCLKIQYQPFSTQVYAEADLYGQYQWACLISGFQLGSANGRHWQDKKNFPKQEEYGCHVSSQASPLLSCRGLANPLYQRPQPMDGPLFILSSAL